MLIDWNGTGQIDPEDIAISLAMEEAGVFDEDEKEEEEEEPDGEVLAAAMMQMLGLGRRINIEALEWK